VDVITGDITLPSTATKFDDTMTLTGSCISADADKAQKESLEAGGVTSVNGNTGIVTISVNDLTGILPTASLPALSGDVISTAGSNEIQLKDISTSGTYNKLTIKNYYV
jgi:hypothetical protein